MKSLEFKIIRKVHRKTASIVILPNGEVEIRVPAFLREKEILQFADRKKKWIKRKLKELSESEYHVIDHQYESGEKIPLMGFFYTLSVNQGRDGVAIHGDALSVCVPHGLKGAEKNLRVKDLITAHLYKTALEILRKKSEFFGERYDLHPVYVSVKDYRSRWGCCFSDGRIFFNWRIILAPEAIVDYVVVHEICHLREQNHAEQFWLLVEQEIPDWQKRRAWLRTNGHVLRL